MTCSVSDNARAYSEKITSIYEDGMRRLAQDLIDGRIDVATWKSRMTDAIRQMWAFQAMAAVDGDKSRILPEDWTRIEQGVSRQLDYLDGFVDAIKEAQGRGADIYFVANRAALYGGSSQSAFWDQAAADMECEFPARPGDGTSECLGHCKCHWHTECNDKGELVGTWMLGEADHCATCVQRAEEWKKLPLKGRPRKSIARRAA